MVDLGGRRYSKSPLSTPPVTESLCGDYRYASRTVRGSVSLMNAETVLIVLFVAWLCVVAFVVGALGERAIPALLAPSLMAPGIDSLR